MDLDFSKYCVLDGSPTTVLRVPRSRSKSSGKHSSENESQRLKEGFCEISFNRFCSASCGDAALKKHTRKNCEEVKRGSVYQCSTEVRLHKRNDSIVDRKKIEVSSESAREFLEFVDSLCCLDEDSSIRDRNTASMMSISEQSTSTPSDYQMELHCPRPLAPCDVISKSNQFMNRQMFDHIVKSRSSKLTDGCVNYSHRSEGNQKHDMSSPPHLHGFFKFENQKDGPFFEFSVKSPEGSYVARTWKADNTLSWAYTFHSLHSRRYGNANANANGWWFKDNSKQATVVGKMLVSYSISTTEKETGDFIDSMVTELVLYDADQSKRSSPRPLVCHQNMDQFRPELEVGAIVVQVPFKTTESLKFGDHKPLKINVLIPAGIHGSPISGDACGPSSLLERWRSGGVCDCGGWDMACSLDVYGNPDSHALTGQLLMDHAHPGVLFDQGRKGSPVAFSMEAVDDGKYAVNFHAKLSALQAFSICIAFLHSAENKSTILSEDKDQASLHRDSLKVFSEEIASLMDAIAEEEEDHGEEEHFKPKTAIKQGIPSLVLNPPSSPIARV